MFKKILFLLAFLSILASCSSRYYKNPKNPKKVTHRGQRPMPKNIDKKTRELVNEKLKKYESSEEIYHEIPPAMPVTTAVTLKYIEDYKEISMVEMQRYRIPASITLAQGILESASGQGRLARYGNNHFGIKCHSAWKGKTITHDDDEKGECFRRYKYAFESFEDHSQFLVNRSRYASLFTLAINDYEKWAHGLKKAGYATDPQYAQKLIAIIKRYKLYEYDNLVIKADNQGIAITDALRTQQTQKDSVKAVEPVVEPVETFAKPSTEGSPVYYVVQAGDTLYKISREQKVPVNQIMKLNNLNDITSNNLQVGQELRLN
ncbi:MULTISPECIES: glucosaminidase domain-containing protein [Capnocytophaga]|uniref:glucosaminidase domain-containing protein n=1 Tax=Capnocytophaga TaxID=1016 RepID=UPI000BB1D5AD|nr:MULTISPECIES: glucosaminidase domain-containing protein [Capnocytophaga]ATA72054.1 hemagglutinin [Capnocytophaga sp. H4358]